jgi:membrane-bound lytic murein transglycosylase D
MKKTLKLAFVLGCVVTALSAFSGSIGKAGAETGHFPVYASIQPNVSFWLKIYSVYPSNQGVIHDKRNLDIVYDVIDLKYPDQPGSRKINRKRIKEIKKVYKNILKKLAHGIPPSLPEEQRIADLFGPQATAADFRRARNNLRCQVGQKDRFREGVIRSGAYLSEIKEIFRRSGLPEDLAYLPHVESSFNPKAYSKFGAAGIWQFTRSTGRQFMKVGYTMDERRDPITSSYAAARLLQKNYDKLQNWPMALTAYNHGINGMLRARRSKGNYEAIFNSYRSRLFKFASRNFYSEFLAAREVAQNYQQHFGYLNLDEPSEQTEVVLTGYTSFPELVLYLEIDSETLRRLNPALRNPVISGQKYIPNGYRLRLPADGDRDWEALVADLSTQIFKNYQKRTRVYTVRRGDTAGVIARRHRVPLEDLIAVNQLNTDATIYVGQNLMIPLPGEASRMVAESKSSQIKGSVTIASSPPQPSSQEKAPDSARLLARSKPSPVHSAPIRVEPQEKLTFTEQPTAPAYVNIDYLAKAAVTEPEPPATRPAVVKPPSETSETMVNPEPGSSAPPAATGSRELEESRPEMDSWLARDLARRQLDNSRIVTGNLAIERVRVKGDIPTGLIRVEVEETIGHYADWLGVRAQDIRRLNGIRYGQLIHLGQRLNIPLHRVTKEEFEEKRFEYHKEMVEDFFAAYRIEDVKVYSIKSGDNIWTLSRDKFEMPLWLIRRYNHAVDLGALMPDQKLLIPVVEKIV